MQDEQVDETNQVINVAIKLSYCSVTERTTLQNNIFTQKFGL